MGLVRSRRAFAVVAALAACGGGCTFLVDFVEHPPADPCDDGGCYEASTDGLPDASLGDATLVHPDGGADAKSDALDGGHDGGRCVPGTICGYLGGCNCTVCDDAGVCGTAGSRCPEGFNWEAGNPLARCCGGLAVLTNTNKNCGVCGVQCKTAGVTSPQDCQLLDNHYLCVNCASNTECWSGCCSSDPKPSHCAPSNCNTGACPAGICPSPSKCQESPGSQPNYCTYP